MLNRFNSVQYSQEIEYAASLPIPWDILEGKTIVISGATGMIGSYLIDVLMRKNDIDGLGCSVEALGRNEYKARIRLPYFGRDDFSFERVNIASQNAVPRGSADYVIHLASSTHPLAYSSDPIGTIQTNVSGLKNLLEYAAEQKARLLFASSVEIYGENRGDVDRFNERYCGYIDCNTVRACYTESKRLGESMCQAYRSQKGADIIIARIARTYGPTLLDDDSKALSQFIFRAVAGDDVVLKSSGNQRFSYLYVADVISGILKSLTLGRNGEAYNLADRKSDVSLRELAALVAKDGKTKVVFDIPDIQEAAGYSRVTTALMDAEKAQKELKWKATYSLEEGIHNTLEVIKGADVK